MNSSGGCICQDVTISVLYANMHSVNPRARGTAMHQKFNRLREAIAHRPCIIAIVESWLTARHTTADFQRVFGLQDYQIERQDRRQGNNDTDFYGYTAEEYYYDRELHNEPQHANHTYPEANDAIARKAGQRGGGIIVAWRQPEGTRITFERVRDEDLTDDVVNFVISCEFNCGKCNQEISKQFAFTVMYRPPTTREDDPYVAQGIENRITHLFAWFNDELCPYAGWCVVGDFNYTPNDERLNGMLRFSNLPPLNPRALQPTHDRGNVLDYVFASPGFIPEPMTVSDQPISDHHSLSFNLLVGRDYNRRAQCAPCH